MTSVGGVSQCRFWRKNLSGFGKPSYGTNDIESAKNSDILKAEKFALRF